MSKNETRRSARKSYKWIQKMDRYREREKQIRHYGADILTSERFDTTKEYIQHGNVTVQEHVLDVARYSLIISKALRIECSRRELVRGALLHDYFLYDWHTPDEVTPHRLHGFYHAGRALRNASEEYDLSPREADIIKKHMWPLNPTPPMCREAWIVTAADKWCSLLETVHIHRGHGVVEKDRNVGTFNE
ncbi:MAG: HD domain-containing protein [Acetatifactor sp.]|nr:HD domain-containing protein [Acetatifactor sp.]